MEVASSKSPAPPELESVASTEGSQPVRSPELKRRGRNLLWLVVIVILLCELKRIAGAIQRSREPGPAPLNFEIVQNRYRDLRRCTNRYEVEALLGPPTHRNAREPEFEEFELSWWNGGRNWFPSLRVWHKWCDPKSENRWVAVVYYAERGYDADTVYARLKKGF
jgi:hypothetical protein